MAGESFPVAAGLEAHPKYLRCGLLARHLFRVMIGATDAEGRGLADPLTWQQEAALWGPAHQEPGAIEAAMGELFRERLAVPYDRGRMLFLPGRFEHNAGREYWSKSRHPLPPMDLLLDHPEYLDGLRRIDSRGKLLRTRYPDAPRYPELATPEPGGAGPLRVLDGEALAGLAPARDIPGKPGTFREKLDGVGVGVGVGKSGGTRASPRAAPSPEQLRMLQDLADERGRDLEAEARAAGTGWPLSATDVTSLKAHLKSLAPLNEQEIQARERRAALDLAWQHLDPGTRGPEAVARELLELHAVDERRAWGLLQRLADWLDSAAGQSLTDGSLAWADLKRLPELWRAAGLDESTRAAPLDASKEVPGFKRSRTAGAALTTTTEGAAAC